MSKDVQVLHYVGQVKHTPSPLKVPSTHYYSQVIFHLFKNVPVGQLVHS